MSTRTVTVPYFGLPIRIELNAGTDTAEMDRTARILAALATADHDNGREFVQRFPLTCYSRAGDVIGTAHIV